MRRAGRVLVGVAVCATLAAACTSPAARTPASPTTTVARPIPIDAGLPSVQLQPLVPAAPAPSPAPCGPFPPPIAALVAVGGGGAASWEAPLEGRRLATPGPIVDLATAYTADAGRVYAVDLATGEERWRAEVGTDVEGLWLTGSLVVAAVSTPDDGGAVVALSRQAGAQAWAWKAPAGGAYTPAGGLSGAPVLVDGVGLVVATTAGPLVVLDLGNGQPRWSVGGGERPRFAVGDGVVVREDEGSIRALDLRSGITRWTAGPSAYVLAAVEGAVVVTSQRGFGGPSPMRALDLVDGAVRWEHHFATTLRSLVATEAGILADEGLGKAQWLLVDAESGAIRWRSEATGQLQGAPLVLGTHLVTLENPGDSRTQVAARRLSDGVVDWGVVFDGLPMSMAPRAGGGVLVGGSARAIHAGQLTAVQDGHVLWSATVPEFVTGAPAPLPEGDAVVHVFSGLTGCASAGPAAPVPGVSR